MVFSQGGLAVQHIVQDLLNIANRNPELSIVHVFVRENVDDNLLQLMLRATFYSGGVSQCVCASPTAAAPLPPLPMSPSERGESGLLGLGDPFDFGLFHSVFSSTQNVLGALTESEVAAATAADSDFGISQYEKIQVPDDISCIWKGESLAVSEPDREEESDVEEFGETFLENLMASSEKKKRRYRGKRGAGKRK